MGLLLIFLSEEIAQLESFKSTLTDKKEIEEIDKKISILKDMQSLEDLLKKVSDDDLKAEMKSLIENIAKKVK